MQEQSLFIEALEIDDPAQRAAFLDQACADDPALRQRIERLLQRHEQGDAFLEVPATVDTPISERPGTVVGPYKLLEQIGEGGMGAVWMAQQTEPVKRVVALKLIKAGMDSKQVIARFEAERQALALMDHANIARVLDAGTTSAGRPYFVMDLVKGVPITRYCDEHHLTPRQRLELFISVCQAVQHAHQKGIIHRDLKPSNVLVALYDGKPVPKVIDFGVAKAAGQQLTDKTLVTGFGNIVGTLEYMSPEQAEINQLDIDTRSDIYSLGVLLYELLTGSPPFTRKELEKAGMLEMLRVIREQEPSKPSTKLSTAEGLPTLAANRGMEPAKLTKLVRGELDWIVLKALEKDRSRRYETANGFAMDLQRYLHDEPVLAGPPSAGYRLRKFLRRNRGPVLAAGAMAVLLVLGAAVSAWQAWRATRAEGVAEERRETAEKAEQQAKNERDATDRERQRAEHSLYIANMHRIRFELEHNNVTAARALLDLYRPGTGAKDRPGWEWYYWDRVCHAELLTLKGHKDYIQAMAYSPDGVLLASAAGDRDPVVKIWDAVTWDELRALHGHEYMVNKVAFSPDGKVLATGDYKGTVKLWDTVTWTEIPDWKPEPGDTFWCVAFSPDGKTLALAEFNSSKRVKFWDLVGKKWSDQLPAGTDSFRIRYSLPDGNLIGVVRPDGVQLWDVKRKTLLHRLQGHTFFDVQRAGVQSEGITGLEFSPDGQLLATCSRDGTVKLRKVTDGTEVRTITAMSASGQFDSGLWGLAFSPDGKYLVTSGIGTPLKLWEVGTGREVRSLFGRASAQRVSFSPDGTRLASAGSGGELKIWDVAGEPGQYPFLDEMCCVGGLSYSPDGTLLAQSGRYIPFREQVHVCDAETGRLVANLDHAPARVFTFAFSSDSTRIATSCYRVDPDTRRGSGEVRLWDLRSRQVVGAITGFNDPILQLAFFPGDQLLATVTRRYDADTRKTTGEVKLWNVKTGREQRSYPGRWMAFSPNGTTLAVVGNDKLVTLYERGTDQKLRAFPSWSSWSKVAFSPDGKRLCDGRVVWDVTDGREVCILEGNDAPAEFSPDGRRLFSLQATYHGKFLRVWDAATGDLLAVMPVKAVERMSLHPDGLRCAVASDIAGTWIVDARPLTDELRSKREAHNLVAHFIRKPVLKDELLEQLPKMKTISEPVKREALALAAALGSLGEFLARTVWDIIQYPDRSEDQYRRALQVLEEANRVSPNSGSVLNELGIAQFRLGRFKDAIVTLENAFKINTSGPCSPPAGDLIFLAMAQHRLGQKEEARKTLARARDRKFYPGNISPHVWREAEALIEGKANKPKQ